MEGELSSIRNLLSTQATLIHGLAEGDHLDSWSISNSDGLASKDISNFEDMDMLDLDKWLVEFPDLLDVLLAERRVDEALAALDEEEHVVSEAKEMKTLNPSSLMSLETSIIEHRQKLAGQLIEAACQPSTRGLRAATEFVQIALGHCSLLEARGLALCPVLFKLFSPSFELALDANLARIQESTAALAATDDWELDYPPTANRQTGRSSSIPISNAIAFQHKLTTSAHPFNVMVPVRIRV